jgi:hypothetical protein
LTRNLRHAVLLSSLLMSPAAAAAADIAHLLDRTVWVDIGIGRTLPSLSAKEIAQLKRCKEPTMAFQKTDSGWVQTFYPGVAMRTAYASVLAETNGSATTIRFFSEGRSAPAETLHLLNGNSVLVQEAPGFRPHTFLKCVFADEGKKRP